MSQEALDLGYSVHRIVAGADLLDTLPQSCDCLRDYQRAHLSQAGQALHEDVRQILMQAPTGAGKTHEIAAIAAACVERGIPCLILATRTRLIKQIHERLKAFGIVHGVIAAELPKLIRWSALVQVASVDTLHARCFRGNMPLPPAAVVIFDEAHLSVAPSRLKVLEAYPEAVRFGFTATPARKSGASLSVAYKRLIPGPEESWLMSQGKLVPARIFNLPQLSKAELKQLKKDASGDPQADELAKLLNRPKLVGDVVSNWERICPGVPTLVFATVKAHGQALLEDFQARGHKAVLLTDEDPEPVRDAAIDALERGEVTVLINCFLMAYGTDIPKVRCIVLARSTQSVPMYKQMVGRGCRPDPDAPPEDPKDYYYLIDHGRNVENLGLPHGHFEWSLDPVRNVNREVRERQTRADVKEATRTCPIDGAMWSVAEDGQACPVCGWKPKIQAKPIVSQNAMLGELTGDRGNTRTGMPALDPKVVLFFQEACGWYSMQWANRWADKPNSGRWYAWMGTREKFKLGEEIKIPRKFWELKAIPPSRGTIIYLDRRLAKGRRDQSAQRRYG